jgi:hypothetical protein
MGIFNARKFISMMCILLVIAGCGPSPSEISATVKSSMQDKFNTDKNFSQYKLTVDTVDVMHASDKIYNGIANITYDGQKYSVPVKITADGGNVMWNTESGAFSFIAQKELAKAQILQQQQEQQQQEQQQQEQLQLQRQVMQILNQK